MQRWLSVVTDELSGASLAEHACGYQDGRYLSGARDGLKGQLRRTDDPEYMRGYRDGWTVRDEAIDQRDDVA